MKKANNFQILKVQPQGVAWFFARFSLLLLIKVLLIKSVYYICCFSNFCHIQLFCLGITLQHFWYYQGVLRVAPDSHTFFLAMSAVCVLVWSRIARSTSSSASMLGSHYKQTGWFPPLPALRIIGRMIDWVNHRALQRFWKRDFWIDNAASCRKS